MTGILIFMFVYRVMCRAIKERTCFLSITTTLLLRRALLSMDWRIRAILRRLFFLITTGMAGWICILSIMSCILPLRKTILSGRILAGIPSGAISCIRIWGSFRGPTILILKMFRCRPVSGTMDMGWALLLAILMEMGGRMYMLPTIT